MWKEHCENLWKIKLTSPDVYAFLIALFSVPGPVMTIYVSIIKWCPFSETSIISPQSTCKLFEEFLAPFSNDASCLWKTLKKMHGLILQVVLTPELATIILKLSCYYRGEIKIV